MIKQKVALEQRQQLVFTPQMQQAVKILALPAFQLREHIEAELEKNPLLEWDEEKGLKEESSSQIEEDPRIDLASYLDWTEETVGETRVSKETGPPNYENIISRHLSLNEYLFSQLRLLSLSRKEMAISETIIDLIDEDGYLTVPVESIASFSGVKTEEVEKILKVIQELEPVGVGARDLSEAMLIQAKHLGWDEEEPTLVRLIRYHLKDIQARNYNKMAKGLGLEVERVKKLVERLKWLEPKPGRLYSYVNPVYINPDVIARNVDKGFSVELNEEWVPGLRVSPYYKKILLQNVEDETTSYIKEKLRKAVWFLKCIQERESTLLMVAKAIFKKQESFLKSGPGSLVPLRMKDIAAIYKIDKSTVSRAVSGKYAQTPWGIFPLKFFFASGFIGDEREEISSSHIKERVRNLLLNEDPKRPLSDEKLARIFNQEGLKVARRTITKYRQQMGILSSSLRRGE